MLRKCIKNVTDPNLALLLNRNMPVKGMTYSPSQMLFNRRLRDNLPIKHSLVKPQVASNVKQQARQRRKAEYYDRSSRPRCEFERGDSVRVKVDNEREWIPAKIESENWTPRSYVVTEHNGQTVRRNKSMTIHSRNKVEINPSYPSSVSKPR